MPRGPNKCFSTFCSAFHAFSTLKSSGHLRDGVELLGLTGLDSIEIYEKFKVAGMEWESRCEKKRCEMEADVK